MEWVQPEVHQVLDTLWYQESVLTQWGIVIGASLVGAIFDLGSGRIPNWLTLPVWSGGVAWASWIGALPGFADALAGSLLLALPYVLLYAFVGGGAGDAKLMGSIGAWLGVINSLVTLLAVSLAGLVLGLGFALAKRRLRVALANVGRLCYMMTLFIATGGRSSEARCLLVHPGEMQTIPYGVGIFVGTCVAALGVLAWRMR